jgi:signal transduction histidine kinase
MPVRSTRATELDTVGPTRRFLASRTLTLRRADRYKRPSRSQSTAMEEVSSLARTSRLALISRHTSVFENTGRWVLLAVILTTLLTLLQVREKSFFVGSVDASSLARALRFWGTQILGVAPILLVLLLAPPLLPNRKRFRWPVLGAFALCGAFIGVELEMGWSIQVLGIPVPRPWLNVERHTLVVLSLLLAALAEFRRRTQQAEIAVHEAQLNRLRLEGDLAASRLQVLQAQIEPHFLFNSLANVRRLLRTNGPAGRAMLADILRYLETAIPRLREDAPTLGREAELAKAFLAVHQIRMGERLRFEFDIDSRLLEKSVPPMMLLTLIENAIKHGIGPLADGGTIRVDATTGDGQLLVSVRDDGQGLSSAMGHGTGLANIRARLKVMHGDRASLRLAVNQPRGVIATLALPEAT